MNRRVTGAIRRKSRRQETASAVLVKLGHGNRAVDVAVTTTVAIDRARAEYEDEPIKTRIAVQLKIAGNINNPAPPVVNVTSVPSSEVNPDCFECLII